QSADGPAEEKNKRALSLRSWLSLAFFWRESNMACRRPRFIRAPAAWCVAVGLAGLPLVASAQQVDQAAIQEIIVTATKRAENLQEVPFSVSATSQDQIINSGAIDIVDLAR